MSSAAFTSLPLDESDARPAPGDVDAGETSPGGKEPIRWQIVARTAGLVPAKIMADRLIAEGIPARAWQEGAGQALGLTVGLLGNGHVAVPHEYEEQARAILAQEVPDPDPEDDWFDDEDSPVLD